MIRGKEKKSFRSVLENIKVLETNLTKYVKSLIKRKYKTLLETHIKEYLNNEMLTGSHIPHSWIGIFNILRISYKLVYSFKWISNEHYSRIFLPSQELDKR